jgi:Mg2+ and Co2+ transporter CorA
MRDLRNYLLVVVCVALCVTSTLLLTTRKKDASPSASRRVDTHEGIDTDVGVYGGRSQYEKQEILYALIVKKMEELEQLVSSGVDSLNAVEPELVSQKRKDEWNDAFLKVHQGWKTQLDRDVQLMVDTPRSGAGSGQGIVTLRWQLKQVKNRIALVKDFWWIK